MSRKETTMLGQMVHDRRTFYGITIKELAALLNVNFGAAQGAENGYDISLDSIAVFAAWLGLPMKEAISLANTRTERTW